MAVLARTVRDKASPGPSAIAPCHSAHSLTPSGVVGIIVLAGAAPADTENVVGVVVGDGRNVISLTMACTPVAGEYIWPVVPTKVPLPRILYVSGIRRPP